MWTASNCVVFAYIQFRDVHQKWIEGGNYELCIEDVCDEIWDMVKPADPLRITLSDLLSSNQCGNRIGQPIAMQALNSLREKQSKSSSRVMKGNLVSVYKCYGT
ncbi:probable serine/threonine-protein phosphatase 2A regulatory subunit B'' subunit TON2 [Tanacetum coccineum]